MAASGGPWYYAGKISGLGLQPRVDAEGEQTPVPRLQMVLDIGNGLFGADRLDPDGRSFDRMVGIFGVHRRACKNIKFYSDNNKT